MTPEDKEKIAFITDCGFFYYKMMLFGLKNAGATYQQLVNKIFKDQLGRNMEAYVNDMLLKSQTTPDRIADLQETFNTLHRFQMKLNPAKYAFKVTTSKFLKFMILQRGIEVNPEKIKVILEMMLSRTIEEVQYLTSKVASFNRFVFRWPRGVFLSSKPSSSQKTSNGMLSVRRHLRS